MAARRAVALITAALLASAGSILAVAAPAHATPPTQTHAAVIAGDDAPTPPMGYNNWAHFMCNIDEQLIRDQADAIVAKRLADAGYDTVTVDDCWMQKDRDAEGNIQYRSETFPSGMKALGDYIHSKGLKYGIYLDAGTVTCSGGNYMGSYGHMDQDLATLAKWGADYVKMDGCNVPAVSGETKEETYKRVYTEAANAIEKTGRPMVFSNSSPAYFSIPQKLPAWYSVMDWSGNISELWRESWDIDVYQTSNPSTSRWPGIMRNYDYNKPIQRFNSVGHWNDPDFIIGGNAGVTDAEGRTQLTLWSMMASPLILSMDTTALTGQYLDDLKNAQMIAIDQDPAGVQGTLISSDGAREIMYRPLDNGDFAVSLLNRSASTTTVSTTAEDLGFNGGGSYSLSDVWSGDTETSNGTFSAELPPHAAALFRVTPGKNVSFSAASGQIMATDQTLCLDATGTLASESSALTLESCTGDNAQHVVRGDNGTLKIDGKCLVPAGGGTIGSSVTLADCTGTSLEQWGYKKNGQLINSAAALCLATSTGTEAQGTPINVAVCGNNPLHQIWSVPGNLTPTVTPLPPVPPTGTFWASDVTPASASVGYGILGKDSAIKDAASDPDTPLTAYWVDPDTDTKPVYAKGWGTHAPSTITYNLAGNCSVFSSDVFMQDGFAGHVVFTVVVDGKEVFHSEPAAQGTAPQSVSVDLDDADTIELHADPAPGHNINAAHADWGDAKFVCGEGDTQVPVTSAAVSPKPAASGWYTKTPKVTLSATDDGSVFNTQYRLNSADTWTTYTAPFPLDEGVSRVYFRSIDTFGNREDAADLDFKVDTVAPRITAKAKNGMLHLKASDDNSGIALIEYSFDAGTTWKTYTKPVGTPGAGDAMALFRATDKAGLVSAPVDPIAISAASGDTSLTGESSPSSASVSPNNGSALAQTGSSTDGTLWAVLALITAGIALIGNRRYRVKRRRRA